MLQHIFVSVISAEFTTADLGSQDVCSNLLQQTLFPRILLLSTPADVVSQDLCEFTPAYFGSQDRALIHSITFWFPGFCFYLLLHILVPGILW